MALLDISRVTETLVRLIDRYVTASPVWPAGAILTVTPEPPDGLAGDNALGLYLYHITEDPHFRNLPPVGNETAPTRHAPFGLNLYYLLTAHSDIEGANGSYREQLMMGVAMKALHDIPVIDDSTRVGGVPVMDPTITGADNRFRIAMNQMSATEALSYWSAGSNPVRLASYYMASVVLLEPEPLPVRPGRVLRYGVFTFTRGAPHLTGSRSTLTFSVPDEPDPLEVEARPAQAAPGETVVFTGSALAESPALLLTSGRWTEPVEADAAWNLTHGADESGETVTVTVQQTAGAEDILPGIYGAMIRTETERTMPDGSTRTFQRLSNQTSFLVSPRLDPIPDPGPTGETQITGFIFQHPDLNPGDIDVFTGETRLTPGTSGSLAQGEFAVENASTISIRLPAGIAPGTQVPVRVFVNGVESAPQWVVAP